MQSTQPTGKYAFMIYSWQSTANKDFKHGDTGTFSNKNEWASTEISHKLIIIDSYLQIKF